MKEYQKRVIQEKSDLDAKLSALVAFSNTSYFIQLKHSEQERLNTQRHLMCAYSAILGARIAEFNED